MQLERIKEFRERLLKPNILVATGQGVARCVTMEEVYAFVSDIDAMLAIVGVAEIERDNAQVLQREATRQRDQLRDELDKARIYLGEARGAQDQAEFEVEALKASVEGWRSDFECCEAGRATDAQKAKEKLARLVCHRDELLERLDAASQRIDQLERAAQHRNDLCARLRSVFKDLYGLPLEPT
jgi:chromosome segregation ATPase